VQVSKKESIHERPLFPASASALHSANPQYPYTVLYIPIIIAAWLLGTSEASHAPDLHMVPSYQRWEHATSAQLTRRTSPLPSNVELCTPRPEARPSACSGPQTRDPQLQAPNREPAVGWSELKPMELEAAVSQVTHARTPNSSPRIDT
jgi:hypothetical protein